MSATPWNSSASLAPSASGSTAKVASRASASARSFRSGLLRLSMSNFVLPSAENTSSPAGRWTMELMTPTRSARWRDPKPAEPSSPWLSASTFM